MRFLPLKAMRARSAGQTGNFVSAALGNNTWDVAMPVVVDGNDQGTSITCDIFIGGVVFDGGFLSRTLLPGSHPEFQWSGLLHFYKAGNAGSNCQPGGFLHGEPARG